MHIDIPHLGRKLLRFLNWALWNPARRFTDWYANQFSFGKGMPVALVLEQQMISLQKLLDIVCTEAIEYGGLPEVPDRVDGAMENYHAAKRTARGEPDEHEAGAVQPALPPIQYDLELIEDERGKLHWVR